MPQYEPVSDAQKHKLTTMTFRPHGVLPPRGEWDATDHRPFVRQLPDTLAGLLRQFTSQMLDLGRLGIDDQVRYQVYRGQVFDARDRLLHLLHEWLVFWGMTDEKGELAEDIYTLLTQEDEEAFGG